MILTLSAVLILTIVVCKWNGLNSLDWFIEPIHSGICNTANHRKPTRSASFTWTIRVTSFLIARLMFGKFFLNSPIYVFPKCNSIRFNELSRDMTKPTKCVRPAKIQISLGIRPVWSEFSLCAQWVAKDPAFFMRTAKTLVRQGGCPGWSESSLGAHSLYWFCHVAAHLLLCHIQLLS